jgi:crotonobetainyl-CoA:carnitine CoA-transferase CaiB-like acyl-CoA transferase
VQSDAEWRRLHALLPDGARARLAASLTTAARLRESDALDAAIAGWTAEQDGEALAAALQACGIAAHVVSDGGDVLADPQLAHRQHYRRVRHAKLGEQLVDAPAFRIAGLEPRIEPGPLYAAHTGEVIAEWLGAGDDELADWIASGALDFA